ncbi:MAG: Gfo/Idh/MocA family oxidoreductase [Deltaproteobacteria bacterium]|nr:Gfo/Idh/MocA family oxidoreductase [Deltaproteobacteria bacterium]
MAKEIRTAVIGTGYLGRFHAQKYMELPNSKLVGIVDIDKARAEEIAKETNTQPYTDYTELFGKVDAVSIVTPTDTHAEIGKALLAEGIDVLIEKPMTVTTEEAAELVTLAKEKGAILQIGHLERFNAAIVALEGRVNNPVFIESHRLAPFNLRALDVDVVLDLMIHDIDIILSLVDSEIESINATGVPVVSGKVDIANARLTFKNGCVANITASRVSKEPQRRVRLFQHDAYIAIDYAAQNISISRLDRSKGGLPSIVEEELDIEKVDSLKEEIIAFLNSVTTRTRPAVSGEDGKRALMVAAQIQEKTESSLRKIQKNL